MHVLLLIVAFNVVYCFAVWRWTQPLPSWARPLTRSLLLCLLCPSLIVRADGTAFVPLIVQLTFHFGSLKPDELKELASQFLSVWLLVYGFWMATIELCRLPSQDPVKMRRLNLVALFCSWPSWILIAGFIIYRFWIDGHRWPYLDLFAIPCLICAVGSLVAMTIFLISMSEYSALRSSIPMFLWSAFPLCLAFLAGCLLCFLITFGDLSVEDLFSP